METKTSLHPIHPTLQFEAKQAIRLSSGEAAALEDWLDDEDCE